MPSKKPRTGAKLSADNLPDTGVVLLPELNDTLGPDEWGVSRSCAGFAIDLSPDLFVDAQRRAVLLHHRTAWLNGKRPDTGGEQRELGPTAAAVPGRQSPNRGYRTGFLADHVKATPIRSDGRTATCSIVPPPERNAYLAGERKRGINLLTLSGKSREAAEQAAAAVLAAVATGHEVLTSKGEVEGDDA